MKKGENVEALTLRRISKPQCCEKAPNCFVRPNRISSCPEFLTAQANRMKAGKSGAFETAVFIMTVHVG